MTKKVITNALRDAAVAIPSAKIDQKVPHAASQREEIRKALDAGATLTHLDAFDRFNTMKLATRISELRRMGYPVVIGSMITESGKKIATYRKGAGSYNLSKLPSKKKAATVALTLPDAVSVRNASTQKPSNDVYIVTKANMINKDYKIIVGVYNNEDAAKKACAKCPGSKIEFHTPKEV